MLMVLLVKCFQQEILLRDSREALHRWDGAVAVAAALGADWEGTMVRLSHVRMDQAGGIAMQVKLGGKKHLSSAPSCCKKMYYC